MQFAPYVSLLAWLSKTSETGAPGGTREAQNRRPRRCSGRRPRLKPRPSANQRRRPAKGRADYSHARAQNFRVLAPITLW